MGKIPTLHLLFNWVDRLKLPQLLNPGAFLAASESVFELLLP